MVPQVDSWILQTRELQMLDNLAIHVAYLVHMGW